MYNKIHKISDLAPNYDLILMDLWGVIIQNDSGEVETGVIAHHIWNAINQISATTKIIYVSNAPRSREYISSLLHDRNIKVDMKDIVTSGSMATHIITDLCRNVDHKPRIFNLGYHYHQALWDQSGAIEAKTIDEADMFIIALHSDGYISDQYDDILKAAAKKGLTGMCINPDKVFRSENGIMYLAGVYAEKYINYGGKVVYTGKPKPEIFEHAISLTPFRDKSRILMIGDSIETDIIGANTIGIHSGLTVLTGNAKFCIVQHKGTDHMEQAHNFIHASESKPTYFVQF